ncbi:MAG: hypothetical protein AB8D52_12390 [Gammaproteobacteria bacterium]
MDNTLTIISVIGSLASIAAALWAWQQARLSNDAADRSESIKEQLINHKKTSDLVELETLLNATRRTFTKYGSENSDNLLGFNQNEDAKTALEFIHKLITLRDYFFSPEGNTAEETFDKINHQIDAFKNAKDSAEISVHGKLILNSIVIFSPYINRELAEQREQVS